MTVSVLYQRLLAVAERQRTQRVRRAGVLVLVVAANIDPLESHVAPLALEALEALGVVLEKPDAQSATAVAAAQTNERLLKVAEIEGRQKTWAWILAAVLVLLVIETVIAGRVLSLIHI